MGRHSDDRRVETLSFTKKLVRIRTCESAAQLSQSITGVSAHLTANAGRVVGLRGMLWMSGDTTADEWREAYTAGPENAVT